MSDQRLNSSYNLSFHPIHLVICLLCSNASSELVCYEVRECDEDPVLRVERMTYEISTDSWNSESNHICPRSDPNVPQWLVLFKDSSDSKISSGSFCSMNEAFNASDVCVTSSGELIFQNSPPSFQGTDDEMEFRFSTMDDTYETSFIIRYAPTNVYSDKSTVYFDELEQFATLNWYIYHEDTDPSVKLYFNNQLLTDSTINLNKSKYSVYSDASFQCVDTSTGDSTIYYSLFVLNPTSASSAGEYVLVVDTYSATVTLEPHPASQSAKTSSSIIISSSNMVHSSFLSSITHSISITESYPRLQSTTAISYSSTMSSSSNIPHEPLQSHLAPSYSSLTISSCSKTLQLSSFTSISFETTSVTDLAAVTSTDDSIVLPVVLSIILFVLVYVALVIVMTTVVCLGYKVHKATDSKDIETSQNTQVEETP